MSTLWTKGNVCVLALLAIAGCSGAIGGSAGNSSGGTTPPPTGTGGTAGGAGAGAGGSGGSAAACSPSPQAAALHARMLLATQYDNTIADLFKVTSIPGTDGPVKPSDGFVGGFSSMLDSTAVGQRASAAAAVASQAAAQVAMWSPCATAACAPALIDWLGLHAYRHPLAADEKAQLQTLFDAGAKAKDFTTGVDWLLTGVLQSPDFLYQFSKPSPSEQAGRVMPISGYEMASRLSYFIWDTVPDDALFAAASSGDALASVASMRTQITRMVNDPDKLVRGVGGFYSDWLQAPDFLDLSRDDPKWSVDMPPSLWTSMLMTVTQPYTMASPNISALLTGETYPMDKTLRAFYGIDTTATGDWVPTDLPGEGRMGLLTHPAFLSQMAKAEKTHPINRGVFILNKLLCEDIKLPPNFNPPATPDTNTAGVTTRQETEAHVQPACAPCHNRIDPPGFALEDFNQVGRYRTMENGVTVDTSGMMVGSGPGGGPGDVDGPFAKGSDLLQRLSVSHDVRSCFAQQVFEYAVAGDVAPPDGVDPKDQCSVSGVSTAFAASGDLKALLDLVATSDSFRFRTSEGAAP